MSRHRNIRSMNIDDECEGYDDVYGHSVEDDYCISPGTAAQFMFNRERQPCLSSYMAEREILEEENEDDLSDSEHSLNESGHQHRPKLSEYDEARLNSCLEQMRSVVGESTPEHVMVDTILKHNFDFEKALDSIFGNQEKPKPQRQPRPNRRQKAAEVMNSDFTLGPPPAAKVKAMDVDSSSSTGDLENNVARITVSAAKKEKTPPSFLEKSQTFSETESNDTKKNNLIVPVVVKKSSRESSPAKDNEFKDIGATPSKSKFNPEIRRGSKQIDRIDLAKELEKRKAGKTMINLVVIGHVDAGKSTLMGHLLYKLGCVSKKAMHKYETESKKLGKASFAYAWVLDETEEERARGVTMDVAQTRFQTTNRMVNLMDAPGHKDFIPNMITGAVQADVAILVVNATRGEFETGFEAGGQTREHALLVRSLGVTQITVAINKMDTVDWSKERYGEIVKKLGQFLKQAGFKEVDLSFVPCSGLSGQNLVDCSDPVLTKWYDGPTLVDCIDQFRAPERPVDKPFRMCIADVYKGMGAGFAITGKVEAGCVQLGDRLLVMPAVEAATVKAITVDDEMVQCTLAGEYADVTITGIDIESVPVGSLACDISNPIRTATRIRARIVVFNIDVPITRGFPVVFHYQTMSKPATIRKLISQLHKSSGEIVKKKPRCITKNSNAVIELELQRPICIELYKDYKDLGRFMLRYAGMTIAAGLVTEILESKPSKTE